MEEAKIAVDKVINYSATESFGDWRLNICFVGDDNDESETVHSLQAEQLADYISTNYPIMNVDKIYWMHMNNNHQQVVSVVKV